MITSLCHDDLGRLALSYLAGRDASGLPIGAAFLAFRRHHSLTDEDAGQLRKLLALVDSLRPAEVKESSTSPRRSAA